MLSGTIQQKKVDAKVLRNPFPENAFESWGQFNVLFEEPYRLILDHERSYQSHSFKDFCANPSREQAVILVSYHRRNVKVDSFIRIVTKHNPPNEILKPKRDAIGVHETF